MTAVERIARELSRWIEDGPFEDVEPEARRILDLLEPEVREREKAAFVAGDAHGETRAWHTARGDRRADGMDDSGKAEAERRHPKEEKA